MKRLVIFAAAAVCALSFSSCAGRDNSSSSPSGSQATSTTQSVTEASVEKSAAVITTSGTAASTVTTTSATIRPIASEAYVNTGTFSQYSCALAPSTACGAIAGTLILQSISYLSGDKLTQRMNTVRNYSALGDEYSCGGPQYYLCGFQISNSLNRYLKDNGIQGYRLTNHRTGRSTEQTLKELISTGRPAVLEVCYANGEILADYRGYSHWICINGYRTTKNGVQFRYSDTITNSQLWVSSELLDRSNANVSYGSFYLQPERYIVSFDKPLSGN